MDDLRSAVAPFDPDAPLPAAPEPWAAMPTPAVRPAPPWAMHEMVAAEPALAARIVDRLSADGSARALADEIRRASGRGERVVVTGCGTSEHAAEGIAGILDDAFTAAALPGPAPTARPAFELSLEPPSGSLVIGVSHEGATAATIAALRAAQARGARTALVTGSAGAPAASDVDVVLATVEMDRGWCHTVGYVSPLVAAVMVAGELAGRPADGSALRDRLAAGIDAAHGPAGGGEPPDATVGRAVAAAARVLVVGSGDDRITARELVLKIEEASWLPAAFRELETLLHGHLPATGPDTGLVLVLLEPRGAAERRRRARQALRAAVVLGMRPAAILSASAAAETPADLTPGGRIVVPDADALPAATGTLFGGAGPLQLVTLAIAAARGTNPDPIRRDDPVYLRAAAAADAPDA